MKQHLWWLLPVLLMALITPFTPAWDMEIEHFFYREGFASNTFYDFMFNYSVIPAQIVGALSLIALVLSFSIPSYRKWRPYAWVLVLTLAIGAGLIVHVMLKDRWGRPRPKQVVEFGGTQAFRPYYSPNFFNQPEPSKGFPCGHCTMGFYFFAVALVCQRLRLSSLAYLNFFFALLLGTALGITRMAQGGHFFSDVLMTGLIMWLCAGIFDTLFFKRADLS